MRIDKYYATYLNIYGDKSKKLKELGYEGVHNQFRIVCKAKSRAEANRMAESYGLGEMVFRPKYTSETGNSIEIEFADKYGFIVNINGNGAYGKNYIDIKSIL